MLLVSPLALRNRKRGRRRRALPRPAQLIESAGLPDTPSFSLGEAGTKAFRAAVVAAARVPPTADPLLPRDKYAECLARASADMRALAAESSGPITLDQRGNRSSVFGEGRDVYARKYGRLNLDRFFGIIDFDAEALQVTVGGKTDFKTLTEYLLPLGFTVPVAPELDTITFGGAVSGIGIESGSFRHGFVHNTVSEMDVLLPDGRVVTCNRDDNEELFTGIPHTYGTLGYVLSATVKVIPAAEAVTVTVHRLDRVQAAVDKMASLMEDEGVDFMDGIVRSPSQAYVIFASFAGGQRAPQPEAPWVRLPDDGRFFDIVEGRVGSVGAERPSFQFRMSTYDYLWRWDCDMFWGTRRTPVLTEPWFRELCGREVLRSKVLWGLGLQIRTLKEGFAETFSWLPFLQATERIIQDLGVPLRHTADFTRELEAHAEPPFWLCPWRCKGFDGDQPLFPVPATEEFMMDVASFGAMPRDPSDRYFHNRGIDGLLQKFEGKKTFYSDVFYSKEFLHEHYNGEHYAELKAKYDPLGVLPHLHDKVVTQ